jgi:bifunctional DNA-binding transcriptional regulator/antitoxin component of YhaV-PrlF toxin-antitoxin module
MYEELSDFDRALARFGDKVALIAELEISGKMASDNAYLEIKRLYKELKMSDVLQKPNSQRTYYTELGEDGFVEIPIELLEELGWEEGTEVTIEVDEQDNTIVIRKVDTSDFPGCGGDILTDEEKNVLDREGLSGLFKMKSPWDDET